MALQLTTDEARALAGQVIIDSYAAHMKALPTLGAVVDNTRIWDLAAEFGVPELTDEDLNAVADAVDTATAVMSIEWPTPE